MIYFVVELLAITIFVTCAYMIGFRLNNQIENDRLLSEVFAMFGTIAFVIIIFTPIIGLINWYVE